MFFRFKYKLVNEAAGNSGYKLIPEADLPGATKAEKVLSIQQAHSSNFLLISLKFLNCKTL
jgi:hypothetical protein